LPATEVLDVPYSFDRVWDAAMSVLQRAKWNVTKADKETGGIEVHVLCSFVNVSEFETQSATRLPFFLLVCNI